MKFREARKLGPIVFRDPVLLCGGLYLLLYFDAGFFCGWGCWQHSCMSGGTLGYILPCLGSFRSLKSPLPVFVCAPGAGK